MTSKVQGEGDYESAQRYDEETRKFVEEKQARGEEMKGSAKDAQPGLTESEREALRHAKSGDEDRRDADQMRKMESQRQGSQHQTSQHQASQHQASQHQASQHQEQRSGQQRQGSQPQGPREGTQHQDSPTSPRHNSQ
jgi:hypothetical protein